MKKLILLAALAASAGAFSQSNLYLRADSIRILKVGDSAELILMNASRQKTGAFLKNRYDGRTEFGYALDSAWTTNDSTLVLRRGDGNITLNIPGSGGGGSGSVNSGTQYRLGIYATTGTTISEAAAITINRALISDANGIPTHSAATATELGYVSGVTSAIQTQINAKLTGVSSGNNVAYGNSFGEITHSTNLRFSANELIVGNIGVNGLLTLKKSSDGLSGVYLTANPATTSYILGPLHLGSTATVAASSMLEMTSTTQGFLAPRMTTAQRDAISSPATGLILYNTTTNVVNVWDGTAWIALGSGGGGVTDHGALTGLSDDDHTIYALLAGRGTPQQFAFGTASGANTGYFTSTSHATKGRYYLNAGGNMVVDELNERLGIGIVNPVAKLQVGGSVADIWAFGSSYAQMVFGSSTGDYAEFYKPTNGAFAIATTGEDVVLSSTNGGYTGLTGLVVKETSGNVGIGIAAPGYKLDVVGTLNATGVVTFPNLGTTGNRLVGRNSSSQLYETSLDPANVITTGSNEFIKNQFAGVQSANFVIDGLAGIGTAGLPSSRLEVATTTTGETSDRKVVDVYNAGATFNTTSGVKSSIAGSFASTSTRDGGANDLSNYGLSTTANGAQRNFGIQAVATGGSLATGIHVSATSATENNAIVVTAGNVIIGGSTSPTSANSTLTIVTGTAPTSSVSNAVILYAEDANAELKVRDEAGNISTISPHAFTLTKKSHPMAWSFQSKNHNIGYEINVDMFLAMRTIEKQSLEIEQLKKDVAELKGLLYQMKESVKLIYMEPIKKNN